MASFARVRLVALAASILCTATVRAEESGRLWIGVEGANPPFHFVDRERKLAGMEVEIAEELCRRLLRTCVFRITEWEELKPALLAKNIDLIVSSLEIPRKSGGRIAFSRAIYTTPWSYVARADTKIPATAADYPDGLRVGISKDGPAADFLARRAQRAEPGVYATNTEALLDLSAGRVDLVLMPRDQASRWLNDTPEGACCRVLANAPPDLGLTGRGVGIGLRATDIDLASTINRALDDMRSDGALGEILRRWLLFPVM